MKRLLHTLYVLLALVFCLTLLVACGDQNANQKPTSRKDMLFLVQGENAMVQIVRSDRLTTNDTETKCAVNIMTMIREMTGVKLSVVTDYTGEGGAQESEYEILVGDTARTESQTAKEQLGDKDYLICVVGTKLCLVARNDLCLKYAVEQFFANHLYYENGEMFLSKKLSVRDMFVLKENTYLLVPHASGAKTDRYDESVAIACVQGIMNRESPNKVYLNDRNETPIWLEIMQEEGRWLEGQEFLELSSFTELLELSIDYIKKVIIWDPELPATVNVACTMAGVEDGIVMTQKMYDEYKDILVGKEVFSLVNMFTGEKTGSAKNDAYRWAIENYLETGLCSTDYLCSYIDSYSFRASGNTSYTVVRDWGVYHRAFVYDLSPWDDEAPLDDPKQEIGTDYETLTWIYNIMLEQTRDIAPYEVCGFFEHQKYSAAGNNSASNHGTVATEWQYAKLMTPYNGYHNTCIDAAWNESFHGLYDGVEQLENNRPSESVELTENTVYLCFFMGDYDSTHPVYRYLKQAWDDPRRGELPMAWAINPNLIETYPDIIEYYYKTATENDYFVSDASAAGYFMPNQVPKELWPKMLEHNLKYFKLADMSIAPMVLDTDHMSELALSYMTQIAPDGLGTVSQKKNYMYGDTVITSLLGGGYDRYDPEKGVKNLSNLINSQIGVSNSGAILCMLRCVWSTPSVMCEMVELYQEAFPYKNVVVVDIYTYFDLMRQDLEWEK